MLCLAPEDIVLTRDRPSLSDVMSFARSPCGVGAALKAVECTNRIGGH